MMNYGIKVQFLLLDEPVKYNVGDIIACENFILYKEDYKGRKYGIMKNVNSHYMYVVEIGPNGKVIVSSYGEKYIFDERDATWTSKMTIKLVKKR